MFNAIRLGGSTLRCRRLTRFDSAEWSGPIRSFPPNYLDRELMLSATALRRPQCYFQGRSRDQLSARVKWEFVARDRETVVFSDQGTSRSL